MINNTDEPIHRPDLRIEGDEEQVLRIEGDLGEPLIAQLAEAARRNDVMISLTISPYGTDVGGDDEDDDS